MSGYSMCKCPVPSYMAEKVCVCTCEGGGGERLDGGGLKVQARMEKPAWAAATNLHVQNTVARCKHHSKIHINKSDIIKSDIIIL